MGDRDAAPFGDNWAYIKTEINWLDRLLALAIGRQRREQQALAPFSRSAKDQVSQHWWKGLVTLDQPPSYDEGRPPRSGIATADVTNEPNCRPPAESSRPATSDNPGYQQQLAARIQASASQGILLSLPALQQQLQLSLIEKQVILMGLAPEVNRRYSQIYAFLQDNESSLPQLDLALKLLCRNDSEWQVGRSRLVSSSLVRSGLIRWVAPGDLPQLRQGIQLAPALVDFLLSATTSEPQLRQLLSAPLPPAAPIGLAYSSSLGAPAIGSAAIGQSLGPQSLSPYALAAPPSLPSSDPVTPIGWSQLILPKDLKQELQHLAYRLNPDQPGTIALFYGPPGTGKSLAARAIASQSLAPLLDLDLRHYEPSQLPGLLDRLQHQSPCLLLLRSARLLWAEGQVTEAMLHRFWQHRRDRPGLTLLSDNSKGPSLIPQSWQERCDRRLAFPLPDLSTRRRLWQRLLPQAGTVQRGFPWSQVARWELSAAQIAQVAQDAARYAAEQQGSINYTTVNRAWTMRYAPLPMSLPTPEPIAPSEGPPT
jgi:hypothetical protein